MNNPLFFCGKRKQLPCRCCLYVMLGTPNPSRQHPSLDIYIFSCFKFSVSIKNVNTVASDCGLRRLTRWISAAGRPKVDPNTLLTVQQVSCKKHWPKKLRNSISRELFWIFIKIHHSSPDYLAINRRQKWYFCEVNYVYHIISICP